MSLTDDQLDRYARHIILKEIGGSGQQLLLRSTVAMIGAGGIGSPALLYLAAAGIGTLRIVDDDTVALDNLQRQILFGTDDVGSSKDAIAAEAVARLNPEVCVEPRAVRLTRDNAAELIGSASLVVDGSDNFATRLAVSDAATALRIPLVSAAIGRFQAQIGTYRGWEPDQPCYRCFVGNAHDCDESDTCSEVGVLGAMVGVAGAWAAMDAIRQICGFGDDQAGKLHIFDGLAPSLRTIRIVKDPACRGCGGDSEAEQA